MVNNFVGSVIRSYVAMHMHDFGFDCLSDNCYESWVTNQIVCHGSQFRWVGGLWVTRLDPLPALLWCSVYQAVCHTGIINITFKVKEKPYSPRPRSVTVKTTDLKAKVGFSGLRLRPNIITQDHSS